mmetsp:Transcript_36683/g.88392  ORF Transcript_36683/g.88392 Transcript_36683/m.88392 type:complete len:270 (+) Transcript_36683:692-1501(+)
MQGGDFVFGNGSGGESVFGKKFKDERAGLALKHDRAGLLSMGNSGKNSNTSQFFVTLDAVSPKCDGKHVIFGEVISGMEVVRAAEERCATTGEGGGEPSVPVTIVDCGAYVPLATPGAGFWYDRPDAESYAGTTPEFVIRPRVGILAPNGNVVERFSRALGEHASILLPVAVDVAEGSDGEEVVRSVMEALEKFALDVVVAAPACSELLKLMSVPSSWKDAAEKFNGTFVLPKRQDVFIEAKPVEALSAILSKSWVGTRPGWLLSASFR